MPKAIATCTCRHCGKTFQKELFETGKGASKRLAEKVEWAENGGIDECPDCWKARQRAEQKAAGLTCDIRLSSIYDNALRVFAVFGGDSYPHKDELKSAGCRWTDEYPEGKVVADILSLAHPRPAWVLTGEDPDSLIEKAKSLGATVKLPDPLTLQTWSAARAEVAHLRAKKTEDLGPIPAWPESVREKWPDGASWNGKIYGKPGARRVYFSGSETFLTDEEADLMEKTQKARAEWRQKKEAIG